MRNLAWILAAVILGFPTLALAGPPFPNPPCAPPAWPSLAPSSPVVARVTILASTCNGSGSLWDVGQVLNYNTTAGQFLFFGTGASYSYGEVACYINSSPTANGGIAWQNLFAEETALQTGLPPGGTPGAWLDDIVWTWGCETFEEIDFCHQVCFPHQGCFWTCPN